MSFGKFCLQFDELDIQFGFVILFQFLHFKLQQEDLTLVFKKFLPLRADGFEPCTIVKKLLMREHVILGIPDYAFKSPEECQFNLHRQFIIKELEQIEFVLYLVNEINVNTVQEGRTFELLSK